tara:strand:- start:158 stop:583 length:426 start_codon:yes stop_codon:yes gene_type:complete
MKKGYGNYRASKSSDLRFKKYKDKYELNSLKKQISDYKQQVDNRTLEEKLNLMNENFEISDKGFKKYLSIKNKLNGGRLFKGEITRYQKELKKIKDETFDNFKKTWFDLNKYRCDLPSETFKIYHKRYKAYNYDITRNSFN